jgi:hypothetical protein
MSRDVISGIIDTTELIEAKYNIDMAYAESFMAEYLTDIYHLYYESAWVTVGEVPFNFQNDMSIIWFNDKETLGFWDVKTQKLYFKNINETIVL